VKIALRLYPSPGASHSDNAALDLAMQLLSNESETGMLDSLRLSHRVYAAMAGHYAMDAVGGLFVATVPRLPFGTKRHAMKLCDEQIGRLLRGDFSEETLLSLKRQMQRKFIASIEDINKRALAMIMTYGAGRTWDDYLGDLKSLERIDKQEIVRVANQYLTTGYLNVQKTYGSYPKDHVAQPGYKPVSSKNADRESDYARQLKQNAPDSIKPRLLDLQSDVRTRQLSLLATLYTVDNHVDSLFQLELIYHKGYMADRRLPAVVQFLSMIGTKQRTKSELAKALEQLGATFTATANDEKCVLTLSGYDSRFAETMTLLHEILTEPSGDKKMLKELKNNFRIERRMMEKDNNMLSEAMLSKIIYGDRSECLLRLTPKEIDKVGVDGLLSAFNDMQRSQMSIVYSGTLSDDQVERSLRRTIPLDHITKPAIDASRKLNSCDEPAVYFLDMPKLRQTVICSYTPIAPQPDEHQRAVQLVWAQYFGEGMSSLLFQEIRERRSMAYTATGYDISPSRNQHPDWPTGFCSYMSTQADKAVEATEVLLSLLNDMPMRESNLTSAKRAIASARNNNYPSMRNVGMKVAMARIHGYGEDPQASLIRQLPSVTPDEVERFFSDNVRNAPHILFVIGDKKHTDLDALGRYGKLATLKTKDIIR